MGEYTALQQRTFLEAVKKIHFITFKAVLHFPKLIINSKFILATQTE